MRMMKIPIVVILEGILIVAIEHPAYWKSVMLLILVGMVTGVNIASVYRFIPVTVYEKSIY